MFIAHLPAAYVALRLWPRALSRRASTAFLAGAVAPDLDLIWFYTLGARAVHHHDYITHRPALWLALLLATWPHPAARALSLGALLHLALDTVTGKVAWLWPLSARATPLVAVPATQDHWVLSFLLHWSFGLELAILALATALALRTIKNPA